MAAQKLTLSIEPDVIDKAKQYAKKQHTSISKLVQNYLKDISANEQKEAADEDAHISDWVKKLVIANKPTPDSDTKAEYRNHIIEKYS